LPIESRTVDGLAGLLSAALEISRRGPPGSFLWYRGHSLKSHTLLPGLLRSGKEAAEVFDREKRLLTRFRQRSLPYWPAGYPQSDWEHMFAMQHYGMPTRLLDWSENLFVAAHFALTSTTAEDPANPPVLWCIDPVQWNRSTPALSDYGNSIQVLTTSDDDIESHRPETAKRRNKFPVAMFGTHNSGRIVAQRGTFMIWGEDTRPLEDFAAEVAAVAWRLEISGGRAELAEDLGFLGFGETMVFPELASLASELGRTEGWRPAR
jgi:hypothetical protein